MRLLLGIIVGVILTIGVAYLSDASTSGSFNAAAQTGAEQRPMVNWDVVGKNVNSLTGMARDGWKKITG